MDIENIKPYNPNENKTRQLNRMFNNISKRYDQFNDIMSMGLARVWRKNALLSLRIFPHKVLLDIAAGTADISIKAFEHLEPLRVTGIDISEKMLEIGREKVKKAGLAEKIELKVEDVSHMSFEDEKFDAAITSFGIRNFENLDKSLQEIHRVLIPCGKFVVLEMSEPRTPGINQAYMLYTKTLIPFAVRTFSNDKKAYKYLTNSMGAFPQGDEFIAIAQQNGFHCLKYETFMFGVCSLYLLEKL